MYKLFIAALVATVMMPVSLLADEDGPGARGLAECGPGFRLLAEICVAENAGETPVAGPPEAPGPVTYQSRIERAEQEAAAEDAHNARLARDAEAYVNEADIRADTTSSAGGVLVPLLMLVLVAAAVAD